MAASVPIRDVGHLKMEKGEKKLFETRRATKIFREEQRWEYFKERQFRRARPTIYDFRRRRVGYPEEDRNQLALIRAILENSITWRIHRGRFPAFVQGVEKMFM
jgi:hypothetical protein